MKVFWDFLPREFCLRQLAVTKRQERNRISNSVKNESVKVRESFVKLVNSKLYISKQ